MLSLGILAFRWVSLGWMVVLALTAGELRRPALAVVMVAVLVVWTGWLTVARPRPMWPVLVADLALAVVLNLVAGLVMPADTVGERPYFAAGYPVAAAVTWGAARGVGGGVAAGLVLGVSLAAGQLRQRHRPGRRGAGGAARPGRRDAELRASPAGPSAWSRACWSVRRASSRRPPRRPSGPASGRPGWPSASRWRARSTTRCSRPWPWSTSGAGSWPPAARSPRTRWPGWPRWPPARSGPCGR